MKNIKEIKDHVAALIEGNTNEEQVKSLAELNAQLDELGTAYDNLQEKHNNLVVDYGKIILKVGTSEEPVQQEEKQKTLEEIVSNVMSSKK